MRRKLLLAASFVVTALGCQHEDGTGNTGPNPPEPMPNPPAPTTTATTTTATSDPTTTPSATTTKPIIMNPPPPVNDEPEVNIVKQPDGTCLRVVTAKCPPGVMCNPPPPTKVPCPAGK